MEWQNLTPVAYKNATNVTDIVSVSRLVKSSTEQLLSLNDKKLEIDDETFRFLRWSKTINSIDEFKRDLFETGRLFDVQRFILYRKKNETQAEILMIFSEWDDIEKVGDIVPMEGNPNLQSAFDNKEFSQVPVPGIGIDAAFPIGHNDLVFGMDNTHAARKFTQDELTLLKPVALNIAGAYNMGHAIHMRGIDALTKLQNRGTFDLAIDEGKDVFGEKIPQIETVVFFDLDFFKKVNDIYGHQVGDAVLRHTATVLRRECDHLGWSAFRYGWEEFTGTFPTKLSYEEVDSIRKAVEESVCEFEGVSYKITTSIGFCCRWDLPPLSENDKKEFTEIEFPQQISDKRMVRLADKATYKSKDSGRNRTTQWKATA